MYKYGAMEEKLLYQCLGDLSLLGGPGNTSLEDVAETVEKVKAKLTNNKPQDTNSDSPDICLGLGVRVFQKVQEVLPSEIHHLLTDKRIEAGCFSIVLLGEIPKILERKRVEEKNTEESNESCYPLETNNSVRREKAPPAPPDLLSIQQTKVITNVLRVGLYTIILGCLVQETAVYMKLSIALNKFVIGPNLLSIPISCHHQILTPLSTILLQILEDVSVGVCLYNTLLPEIFCSILQLCFHPRHTKSHPQDTKMMRLKLEQILTTIEKTSAIKTILILKGVKNEKGGSNWLNVVCGSLIRKFLHEGDGVQKVIDAALSVFNTHNWKHCEAIASIISQTKVSDQKEFYSVIGPQVSKLAQHTNLKPEIQRILGLLISQLAERNATLTIFYITNDICRPLLQLTQPAESKYIIGINLTACVSRIHSLFVEVIAPCKVIVKILNPVICPLFGVASVNTSHLRNMAKQLIVRCLSQMTREDSVESLLFMCCLCSSPVSPPILKNMHLVLADDGGVRVIDGTEENIKSLLDVDDNRISPVITILEDLKNSSIVLNFVSRLITFIDFTVLNKSKCPQNLLLTVEDECQKQFDSLRKVNLAVSLLGIITGSDKLSNDLFDDLEMAVPILEKLLDVGCHQCENEALSDTQTSLVLNSVMLVYFYVSQRKTDKKMSSQDWQGLKNLLPVLERLKKREQYEVALVYVDMLEKMVLTHGVVATSFDINSYEQLKRKGTDNASMKKHENKHKYEKNIENLSGNESNSDLNMKQKSDVNRVKDLQKSKENIQINKTEAENNEKIDPFYAALEDLSSPLLPVRGGALLSLSKLIDNRNITAMQNSKRLLSIYQHHIKDEDSYIYLMAVEGLSSLCDAFPEKVIELLTLEFSSDDRKVEDRVKIAESLTRTAQRLGPLLPAHKNNFINAYLTGVRDEDNLIRAASLSGLGEVCKFLKFSLGSLVQEILVMLHGIVGRDPDVQVRRAAVLLVTLLLQGLGKNTFQVLRDVLRDIYRTLRLVHTQDPDDVVRLHAQISIEEIDKITREFLLPKLSLTKKIYVTEVPDNFFSK